MPRHSKNCNNNPDKKTVPTTPTTPATSPSGVAVVVGVVSVVGASYKWDVKATLADNFRAAGAALATVEPGLVVSDGVLILVERGRPRVIDSACKLSPLLIDTLNLGLPRAITSVSKIVTN